MQLAPEADVRAAARAANDFGFELWRRARPEKANFVLSPWSAYLGLAMVSAGARGATDAALAKVLFRPGDPAAWHAALATLGATLASRGAGADGGRFRLATFSQLYGPQDTPFERTFVDLLAERYGATPRTADFRGAPDAARRSINADVSRATAGLFPELLSPGAINSTTGLTLVSTVHFSASWAQTFEIQRTRQEPFFRDDGTQVPVMMMSATRMDAKVLGAGPREADGVEVLRLAYYGWQVSLVVLMPPQGKLAELERGLTAARLEEYLARPPPTPRADVALPRFVVRSTSQLREPLTRAGLGPALGPEADFTGISPQHQLFISDIVQESLVETNETGTEAAAATHVLMALGAERNGSASIKVNRPFLFLIQDFATGTVLFLGRFVAP